MKTIHILINCYWGNGMSGGDRRSIELLRRWNNTDEYKFIIYTTHRFAKLLKDEGISNFLIEFTDNETNKNGIIISYFKRLLKCYSLLKRNVDVGDIVYSSTDILPDVFPGYLIKKKIKR